jgi:hypothetical protein
VALAMEPTAGQEDDDAMVVIDEIRDAMGSG